MTADGAPGPRRPLRALPVPGQDLTARELQVLTRVAQGHDAAEIGRQLYLSVHSVKTHQRRAYVKLGTHSGAEAVATCIRAGLINPFRLFDLRPSPPQLPGSRP